MKTENNFHFGNRIMEGEKWTKEFEEGIIIFFPTMKEYLITKFCQW
jgi:hypothetical protein